MNIIFEKNILFFFCLGAFFFSFISHSASDLNKWVRKKIKLLKTRFTIISQDCLSGLCLKTLGHNLLFYNQRDVLML